MNLLGGEDSPISSRNLDSGATKVSSENRSGIAEQSKRIREPSKPRLCPDLPVSPIVPARQEIVPGKKGCINHLATQKCLDASPSSLADLACSLEHQNKIDRQVCPFLIGTCRRPFEA